jgi:hypothetical protein
LLGWKSGKYCRTGYGKSVPFTVLEKEVEIAILMFICVVNNNLLHPDGFLDH